MTQMSDAEKYLFLIGLIQDGKRVNVQLKGKDMSVTCCSTGTTVNIELAKKSKNKYKKLLMDILINTEL